MADGDDGWGGESGGSDWGVGGDVGYDDSYGGEVDVDLGYGEADLADSLGLDAFVDAMADAVTGVGGLVGPDTSAAGGVAGPGATALMGKAAAPSLLSQFVDVVTKWGPYVAAVAAPQLAVPLYVAGKAYQFGKSLVDRPFAPPESMYAGKDTLTTSGQVTDYTNLSGDTREGDYSSPTYAGPPTAPVTTPPKEGTTIPYSIPTISTLGPHVMTPAEIDAENILRQKREQQYASSRAAEESKLLEALGKRDLDYATGRYQEPTTASERLTGKPPAIGQSRHYWP